jgi:hypothetical protein
VILAGALSLLPGCFRVSLLSPDVASTPSSSTASVAHVDFVLGQRSATQLAGSDRGFVTPWSISSDGTRFVVAEYSNVPLLLWNSLPANYETPADLVIGQPHFLRSSSGNVGGVSSTSLSKGPYQVAVAANKLLVADTNNNRVLVWNTLPTTNGQAADLVLGQPDFTSATANNGGIGPSTLKAPFGVWTDGTRIVVSDSSNHRILIWSSWPAVNGQAADRVLGQPDFASATANNGGRSAQSLDRPAYVSFDGTRLLVGDLNNYRVLVWSTFPTANRQAADLVVGQPDMATGSSGVTQATLTAPYSASSDGTRLAVADYSNHRVLLWDTFPTTNGQAADRVLGQPDFVTSTYNNGGSNRRLRFPAQPLIVNGKLLVADYRNSRVLVWNSWPTANHQAADSVIGQSSLSAHVPYGAALDGGSSLHGPLAHFDDGQTILAPDGFANRVLIWKSRPTGDYQAADVILGQPDRSSSEENNGGISASTLAEPSGASTDGTRVAVCDRSNNRVLIWNTFPTSDGQAADLVLGQPGMSRMRRITAAEAHRLFRVPMDASFRAAGSS